MVSPILTLPPASQYLIYQSQPEKKNQSELRKQQNQIKKIEKEISDLELQIKQYNEMLHQEEILNDYQKYNEIVKNIDEANQKLETLMESWEELQI